ncbi:MAG: hypothetical protein MHM6MM_003259 [Cercozoa sp. M6MM]
MSESAYFTTWKSRKRRVGVCGQDTPVIQLNEGWKSVNDKCVVPFLARIEEVEQEEFEKRSIPQKDFSAAYNTIFNMCTQRPPNNFSDQLYRKYTESLKIYHDNNTLPSLREARGNPIQFVGEWVKRWRTCRWAVQGLKRVFQYLDRFYVRNEDGALDLSAQGFKQFREQVFDHFSREVSEVLLGMIDSERDGNDVEVSMREAIWVFVELGHKLPNVEISLYHKYFQERLINSARAYYKRISAQWMSEDSCPDYMRKAEEAVESELARLSAYLHNTTKEPLMRAVREELLVQHQDELLGKETGLAYLMENEKTLDLARMYRLFQATNGLGPVAKSLRKHVTKLGLDIIAKSRAQKQTGEVLSKGNKLAESNTKRIEETIHHVVMLYGYIKDKDVFERDYQMFLASRLLDNRSVSEEAEKSMIGKLKTECGYQWTSKLEAMFNDVNDSNKDIVEFKQSQTGRSLDVDLEVQVCTTGSWPSWTTGKGVLIPRELESAATAFKQFYLHKHESRKLMWALVKGRADVQVYFTRDTKKLLNVTTYQMCVLLLFNRGKNMLSCKEIVDMTGISRADIRAHLLSLAHPNVNILQKKPSNNTLEDSHLFRINPGYKNQLYRIKVPFMQRLQGEALNNRQRKEMEKQQKLQRRHMIDAAIVRIMKTRKKLSHTELVSNVIEQLSRRFSPSNSDIKKRIEDLIEQEYLERDEDERAVYNYKA